MNSRRTFLRSIITVLTVAILIETVIVAAFAAFFVGLSTQRKYGVLPPTQNSLYEPRTELESLSK